MDDQEFNDKFLTRFPWWVYEVLPGLAVGLVALAGWFWFLAWLF